jgi:hypothetical protein
MSIDRQVRIILGFCVLIGPAVTLAHTASGVIITAFMGLSLIFSGSFGFCGTHAILSKMPWNK